MSKQSEAKAAQGYTTVPKQCKTCANFRFELQLSKWMAESNAKYPSQSRYTVELHGLQKELKCGIGGFSVKPTAVCSQWSAK